ncbi:MAG: DUF2723 domain-containing protein [candidate division Zixibacteria bacterium]|nr:DUF2723 domain-containing protein [candidate division Zixibacteria bacterium]
MANLESPSRSFYVGLLCILIGMGFLRVPPVDGNLTLIFAPVLLVLGYGVLTPLGLRPRGLSQWPQSKRGAFISPVAIGGVTVFVISCVGYCLTAWPGPGWWDSGQYIAASYQLWVAPPPGSFFLQLVGRCFAFLTVITTPVHGFNLLIAVLTAGAITVTYLTGVRLLSSITGRQPDRSILIASALGALTLAFSASVWAKATFANPYTFSLLVGAMLMYLAVRWWERADQAGAGNYLLLTAFLLGLDLSVHRSNLLLAPFFVVLVLIRRPSAFRDVRLWLGCIGLFALGLSLQLGLMFRAQLHPEFNYGDVETFSRLWDYFALKTYGIAAFGSDLFERKGPFWSYQINEMYLRYVGWNFAGMGDGGAGVNWSRMYGLPLIIGAIGFVYHVFKQGRSAVMVIVAFLFASLVAIFYLNVPEGFFREMDRHYMVSYMLIALWIGIGAYVLLKAGSRILGRKAGEGMAALILLAILPVNAFWANRNDFDMSGNYTASAFGRNLLETCESDAILFTAGDSDTFLPLYFQAVERVRTDVTVLNIHLLNTPWFLRSIMHYHPDMPWSVTADSVGTMHHIPWETDTVAVAGVTPQSDSVRIVVEPTFGNILFIGHRLVLDIIRENQWRRPIYFSAGFGEHLPLGLSSLARLDGLAWRLCPDDSSRNDHHILADNILDRFDLRGLAGKFYDPTARQMSSMYLHQLAYLGQVYKMQNDSTGLVRVDQRVAEIAPEVATLDSLMVLMSH